MVPSQRQPALQRCWRSSCHGLWKPSRKSGARLIQTLHFIDGRCCHRIDRRVEIVYVRTAPWKTVKQARRTLFRLVKDTGSQVDAQGAGLPAARCDVQSMLISSETSMSDHPSERTSIFERLDQLGSRSVDIGWQAATRGALLHRWDGVSPSWSYSASALSLGRSVPRTLRSSRAIYVRRSTTAK